MLLHMKLFTDWWMPLRMAGKRRTVPLVVEPRHWRHLNVTWNKWNMSLNICEIFHAGQLLQKSVSLQQVCTVSSPTAWENEKFVQSGLHTCSTMTREPCMLFLPPPICSIGVVKALHSSVTFEWLMSHSCIHLTLSWSDRMLNGVSKCHRGRKLHGAVRVLWKSCTSYSSAEMNMCLTILCQFVRRSMASITVHSCRVRWGRLFTMNNQNCLNMVPFCSQDNVTPHCHHDVQNLVQCWDWEMLARYTNSLCK
jgi:hypothetical protein